MKLIIIVTCFSFCLLNDAAYGQNFSQAHAVISSGGNTIQGGSFTLKSSLSQSHIGPSDNNSRKTGVGFWYRYESTSAILTDIEKLRDGEIPEGYSLEKNYPNPFNPSTTIQFSVPEITTVRVSVFDQMGRLLKVLHEGEISPGSYRTAWDATDLNGSPVASGLYLYTLQSEGSTLLSETMMLSK